MLVVTDGTLVVSQNGSGNLFGNTVELRQSMGIQVDACKTRIDTQHALPAGVMQYFYVFIEQKDPSGHASFLWLQIWRPYRDQYQLRWRRLVYLNDSSPQALYAVKYQPVW